MLFRNFVGPDLAFACEARGKSVHAFSFATDESPPEKPRYCGLRFQITYVYVLHYVPDSDWEQATYDVAYPFSRERIMCDIMHAPGKTGEDTLKVLEKQWASLGLGRHDFVCGVGDGGGENEGSQGVHSLMEASVCAYVRRRCLGHLPWRVADAGLDAMDDRRKRLKDLSTFLRDGTTWSRLQAIAVAPVGAGGLALVKPCSVGFQRLFATSPPRSSKSAPSVSLSSWRGCYPSSPSWPNLWQRTWRPGASAPRVRSWPGRP